jgi:predicted nuclease of predicted toxin-antitoxin system
VSKDEDFVDSFLMRQQPFKLLLVAAGNISNDELLDLFDRNMLQLEHVLATGAYVELSRDSIIVHA